MLMVPDVGALRPLPSKRRRYGGATPYLLVTACTPPPLWSRVEPKTVLVVGVVWVAVGDGVGDAVGLAVGLAVGDAVGDAVGLAVGDAVGLAVGDAVGLAVGDGVAEAAGS